MNKLSLITTACLMACSSFCFGDITTNYRTNGFAFQAFTGEAPGANNAFGINNNAFQTFDGLTMTVVASGGEATESIGVPGTGIGYGDVPSGGIGVRGDSNWQIDGNTPEELVLTFDKTVNLLSIDLNGIGVAPNNNDGAIVNIGGGALEFSVFGNSTVNLLSGSGTLPSFDGTAGGNDIITFGTPFSVAAGESIAFRGFAAGSGSFLLQGITVSHSSIPEPSAMILLGACGVSLVTRRRR